MGYQVWEDERLGRFCGYGIPAQCDQPECRTKIDRGVSFLCGGARGGDHGCGLAFCSEHRTTDYEIDADPTQLCDRCATEQPQYHPKPDVPEFVEFVRTDDSWAEWRATKDGIAYFADLNADPEVSP